jgi:hypothetical protein
MELAGKFAGIFNNNPAAFNEGAEFDASRLPEQPLESLSALQLNKMLGRGNSLNTAVNASNANKSGIAGLILDYAGSRGIDAVGNAVGNVMSKGMRYAAPGLAVTGAAGLLPSIGAAAVTGLGADMAFPASTGGGYDTLDPAAAAMRQRMMRR